MLFFSQRKWNIWNKAIKPRKSVYLVSFLLYQCKNNANRKTHDFNMFSLWNTVTINVNVICSTVYCHCPRSVWADKSPSHWLKAIVEETDLCKDWSINYPSSLQFFFFICIKGPLIMAENPWEACFTCFTFRNEEGNLDWFETQSVISVSWCFSLPWICPLWFCSPWKTNVQLI